MKKLSIASLAAIVLLQSAFPVWVYANNDTQKNTKSFIENQVIVKYKKDAVNTESLQSLKSILQKENNTVTEILDEENIVLIEHNENLFESTLNSISGKTAEEKMLELLQKYQADPNVEFVQPNFVYKLHNTENSNPAFNDTYYNKQWYLKNNGEPITGMSFFYKLIALIGYGGDITKTGITQEEADSDNIQSVENVDIGYETAKSFYDKLLQKQTDEEKNEKITVAVIDSGVNYNLKEFEGKMWDGSNCVSWTGSIIDGGCKHGYNMATDTADGIMSSNLKHGTQVSSLIAANTDNEEGIVGIAPKAEIMSIVLTNEKWELSTVDVVKAILFAQLNGADIINMSLGSIKPIDIDALGIPYVLTLEYRAINSFPGLVVASSGNSSSDLDSNTTSSFPASFGRELIVEEGVVPELENLIVVGAENSKGDLSSFSSHGSTVVDIIAPGSDIIMAGNDGNNTELENTDYDMNNGTSFSAPIVTASLTFLKSAYPEKSWNEIRNILLEKTETTEKFADFSINGKRLNLGKIMQEMHNDFLANNPFHASMSISDTSWTNSGVTISIEANRNILPVIGWEKISETKIEKVFSENENVTVEIFDENNQSLTLSHNIENIDKTLPEIAIISPQNNEKIIANSISVEFSGQDQESGINKFECKVSQNWENCDSPFVWTPESNGRHEISIRAVDNARNVGTEKSIVIDFQKNTDTIAPAEPTTPAAPAEPTTPAAPAEPTTPTPPTVVQNPEPEPTPTATNTTNFFQNSGAGGYNSTNISPIVSTINKLLLDMDSNEEELLLSSADDKTNIGLQISPENIFKLHLVNLEELSEEDIIAIFAKNWIQESDNGKVVNFSIIKKLQLLETTLKKIESDETKKTLHSAGFSGMSIGIKHFYDQLFEDWKNGKFFILN